MYNHLNLDFAEYKRRTDNLHKRAEDWMLEEALSWDDGKETTSRVF